MNGLHVLTDAFRLDLIHRQYQVVVTPMSGFLSEPNAPGTARSWLTLDDLPSAGGWAGDQPVAAPGSATAARTAQTAAPRRAAAPQGNRAARNRLLCTRGFGCRTLSFIRSLVEPFT